MFTLYIMWSVFKNIDGWWGVIHGYTILLLFFPFLSIYHPFIIHLSIFLAITESFYPLEQVEKPFAEDEVPAEDLRGLMQRSYKANGFRRFRGRSGCFKISHHRWILWKSFFFLGTSYDQWEFQDPKMEVPFSLYMVGTSNLGSWNGHWYEHFYDTNWHHFFILLWRTWDMRIWGWMDQVADIDFWAEHAFTRYFAGEHKGARFLAHDHFLQPKMQPMQKLDFKMD